MINHKHGVLFRRAMLRRKAGTGTKHPPDGTLLTGLTKPIPVLLKDVYLANRDKPFSGYILLALEHIQVQGNLIKTLSSERPYITSSEALRVAKALGRKLSGSQLSKAAVKGGSIRIEQRFSKTGKPYRKDVHLGDFKRFVKTLPESKESNELFAEIDKYITENQNRYSIFHNEKETKHKESNPEIKGYIRLAKKMTEFGNET